MFKYTRFIQWRLALYKPLIKLLYLQREDEPGYSRVVERNAYLVKLPSVAQLVLAAHTEASVAVEGHGARFAAEGAALNFFVFFHEKKLPLGCIFGCKHQKRPFTLL
jgi:hypothetical protein